MQCLKLQYGTCLMSSLHRCCRVLVELVAKMTEMRMDKTELGCLRCYMDGFMLLIYGWIYVVNLGRLLMFG
jgi:hypothetical protein